MRLIAWMKVSCKKIWLSASLEMQDSINELFHFICDGGVFVNKDTKIMYKVVYLLEGIVSRD